jgi:hypothetical protein
MRSPRPPPAEPPPSRGISRGTAAMLLVLLGFLTAAVGLSWYIWRELGDVAMGAHGWIALALGTGAALALGGGLMWLVYFSNRRGYDDEVERDRR